MEALAIRPAAVTTAPAQENVPQHAHAPRRPSAQPPPSGRRGSGGRQGGVAGSAAAAATQATTNTRHQSSSHGRSNSTRGMKALGPYLIGKTVGEGTFGKVKIGVHTLTGEKVAIKILEKSKITEAADVRRVTREINILKRNRHRNIIQLFEVIDSPSAIYLIMENADGGEMFDYIVAHQRVPEPQACYFFHQIVDGVEYLHLMDITHRDLKPENLLLQASAGGWIVKIVDFGLSNTHEGGQLLSTACGSPCYAAPEMIAGKRYVGPKADLWSMGVILFALVCGYLPFEDSNTSNLYKKILAGDYHVPSSVSREVRDLIGRILDTNPETRYSIADIRRHPWYRQVQLQPPALRLNDDYEELDEEVLKQLEALGLTRDLVVVVLRGRLHNSATAAYYLLLNRKRLRDEKEAVGRSKRQNAVDKGEEGGAGHTANANANANAAHSCNQAAASQQQAAQQAASQNSGTDHSSRTHVPKLPLHEIRAAAQGEAAIEIVPSYQRQTISGACKTARGPGDWSGVGVGVGGASAGTAERRAGRHLRATPPSSRGAVTAREHSSNAFIPAGVNLVVTGGGRPGTARQKPATPRVPSRPKSRARQSGSNVRVQQWVTYQGAENEVPAASENAAAPEEQAPQPLPSGSPALETPTRPAPIVPSAGGVEPPVPAPPPESSTNASRASSGSQRHGSGVSNTSKPPQQQQQHAASPPVPGNPPAEQPLQSNKGASVATEGNVLTSAPVPGPTEAQQPLIVAPAAAAAVAVQPPSPAIEILAATTSAGQAQQRIVVSADEVEEAPPAKAARRFSRYVSQLSQRHPQEIVFDVNRALASLEIMSMQYEGYTLKCSGQGLHFKLQVKTKMPEGLQYLKATCYHGQREAFKHVCAEIFRQTPM